MEVIPLTQVGSAGLGKTSRRDAWWAAPVGVVAGLSLLLGYMTWAMFQGEHYEFGPYLSPVYAPVLWGDSPHAWFGTRPPWWPGFIAFSPAMLILPFPGSFRFTCYYYRGAYYKAFWADPPSCAVGEPRKGYLGENSFPLILQNIHRYTLYIALVFLGLLAWDVWLALWFVNPATGQTEFGIGDRHAGAGDQRRAAGQLHVRVPCPASPGRRLQGRGVEVADVRQGLRLQHRAQLQAPAVRLVQPVLGGVQRPLHPAVLDGHLVRSEAAVMAVHATYSYDVLVIGAGGAGLRAAIEACGAGVSVGLICKSLLGKAHTVMAEGGMAAAMGHNDDRDNWKVHFADTMRGGQYVNNWRMAEIHAKEAPDRVRELEGWGAVFDRTPDGRINQRNFGGHRYPRLAHVGDRTGLELIRTLQDHTVYLGATVHMEHTVVELILDNGRVAGALGYDRERGRFQLFQAKAVVLATGGVGRAYQVTSNSWEGTGDGHALAYRAGAELIDMEFIQFHPTGMVWPPSVKGILVTEGVRGEGGVLKNSEGRRFMFDDIPDNYKPQTASDPEEGWRYTQGDKSARRPPELLTRDHVARCINREVKAGRGSPHGGVFLDIAWIKEKLSDGEAHIKRKLPSMYHQFKELADLDITKEPMEVGPTTHYIMGGVRVDADTQESSVPGLFAAGECAAGINGANRLGGNSLSDLIVFGKRAGEYAAHYAKTHPPAKMDDAAVDRAMTEALAPFERGGAAENPYAVQADLQQTMQGLVGIVRTESEMREAITRIAALNERAARVGVAGHREYNAGWHTCLDLRNLLTVSEAIARSAVERKESRGGHFREDFPEKAAEFATFNHTIRRAADGSMQLGRVPLPDMPAELKQVVEEQKSIERLGASG